MMQILANLNGNSNSIKISQICEWLEIWDIDLTVGNPFDIMKSFDLYLENSFHTAHVLSFPCQSNDLISTN